MKKHLKLGNIILGNVVRISDPISGCSAEVKVTPGNYHCGAVVGHNGKVEYFVFCRIAEHLSHRTLERGPYITIVSSTIALFDNDKCLMSKDGCASGTYAIDLYSVLDGLTDILVVSCLR